MKIYYMGKRIDNEARYNPRRTSHGHFTSFKSAAIRLAKRTAVILTIAAAIYVSGIIGSIYGTPTIVQAPIIAHANTTTIPPVLQRIAQCESQNKQFKANGDIVRGTINPNDVGRYQINELYHYDIARKMHMDIFTEAGNEAYALYLYQTQGTEPWSSSKKCWNK